MLKTYDKYPPPPHQLGSQIGQFIESAISGQPALTGQLDAAVAEVSKFSL